MRIITRLRPETPDQKCYVLRLQTAFGATTITTFLSDKEVDKYKKAGITCEQKE